MEDVSQNKSKKNREDNLIPYTKGHSGNPLGLAVISQEARRLRKLAREMAKELLAEHKDELAAALPEIRPALIREATKGSIAHIAEVHKVIGAHEKGEGSNVAIQVNVDLDRDKYA